MSDPYHAREQADKAAMPFYVVGDEPSGRQMGDTDVRTMQVSVNLDLRSDREFSSARPLHEIPLLMKLYKDRLGGSVTIKSDWAPALSRKVAFTREMLKRELVRLNETYTIPLEKGAINLVEMVYGADADTKLFKKMHEMFILWVALEKRLRAEVEPALKKSFADRNAEMASQRGKNTFLIALEQAMWERLVPKDIEEIVKIAFPDESLMEDISMDGIEIPKEGASNASAAPAVGLMPGEDPILGGVEGIISPVNDDDGSADQLVDPQALQDHLSAAGHKERVVNAFVEAYSDQEGKISEESWTEIVGGGKNAAKVRESLMSCLAELQAKSNLPATA